MPIGLVECLNANVVRFERTPFQQSQPPPTTRPVNSFIRLVPCGCEVLELGDCKDGYALARVLRIVFVVASFVKVYEADDIMKRASLFRFGKRENIQKKKESKVVYLGDFGRDVSVGQKPGFLDGNRAWFQASKDWIRVLCNKNKVSFLSIQETKAEKVSDMEIKSLWGNTNFDAIVSQSLGTYEVRRKEERWGSIFNVYGARDFNHFITSAGLVEVQLEGLLNDMITDLYSMDFNDSYAMVRFKKKLQALKKVIRLWIGNYKRNQMNRTTEIKIKLKDIDKLLDQLGANDDLLSVRSELLKQYHDIHSVETRESIQKAKIKWAVEGDENSKFFHGMINRKRANLAVKGVMIDGEWVDDPSKVKDEFRDYFASRFCDPGIRHGVINFNFPNRLNIDQSGELEAPISRDEIRRAVWDCGENKSPGPDGFTFEFFRKFWNIVGPDLCLAVEWFFHHASLPCWIVKSFIFHTIREIRFESEKSFGELQRTISLIGSIYKIVTKILANPSFLGHRR
ncbi:hypothetical protein Tco_0847005 [Tanacetum coccineum]